jgi:hypothetical protein
LAKLEHDFDIERSQLKLEIFEHKMTADQAEQLRMDVERRLTAISEQFQQYLNDQARLSESVTTTSVEPQRKRPRTNTEPTNQCTEVESTTPEDQQR